MENSTFYTKRYTLFLQFIVHVNICVFAGHVLNMPDLEYLRRQI